jgi:hypothetical protein
MESILQDEEGGEAMEVDVAQTAVAPSVEDPQVSSTTNGMAKKDSKDRKGKRDKREKHDKGEKKSKRKQAENGEDIDGERKQKKKKKSNHND